MMIRGLAIVLMASFAAAAVVAAVAMPDTIVSDGFANIQPAVMANSNPSFNPNLPMARPQVRLSPIIFEDEEDAPSQKKSQGCPLLGQVKLCVNHAAMQRATCSREDLDCQCIWAGVTTTCFSPCATEKESGDSMRVAKGDQDSICQQAAKFGKIAKEKERLRQDEKNNKVVKKKEATRTSVPKNIDDMNNTPSPNASNDNNANKSSDGKDSGNKNSDTGAGSNTHNNNNGKPNSGSASGQKNGASNPSGREVKSGDKPGAKDSSSAAVPRLSSTTGSAALLSLGVAMAIASGSIPMLF
ncbi:hypothetical protein BX661DRAFT_168377 [Kickxella alabastrina]|uniref:uncharacterized protein n=1 Tax=Kickxella alabastrina TaxID=61397 RepID=UPI002220731A|nr:uncharacterized protein BX661DRAFT_168377 [Kickxella alabastrina]KAI7835220.1 hypothetical protein BX661DRAFT_168377 [Kickxella alabastrina]KAJ1947020.1 hypothetical protein GGF37_000752 [Kickxella alabastrina]